jgi:uncharacterized repeat protein (TIGR01451 family)
MLAWAATAVTTATVRTRNNPKPFPGARRIDGVNLKMGSLQRLLTLLPLVGFGAFPFGVGAVEAKDATSLATPDMVPDAPLAISVQDKSLPLCTPGLQKPGATEGALGMYDMGGGKFAADLVEPDAAFNCQKATSGGLSLRVDDISLNLGTGILYADYDSTAPLIVTRTVNPALCESYHSGGSYTLQLRNANNDLQGSSGQLTGVVSMRYQLGSRAFVPELAQAKYGPWLRCFDATLANPVLASANPDTLFTAGFESTTDLEVKFLDATGADLANDQFVSTIGSNSTYKVRITNRGEVAAQGVRVREFLPKAGGLLNPPDMTAIACVNDQTAQNCNVSLDGGMLAENIASIAPGQSITYTLTRKVNGTTAVPAEIGALTSVAAFVNPDLVAERRQADNTRHLRIGLVTNGLPVADAKSVNTNEDEPVAITLSGSDPDVGDTLVTWTIATAPAHGIVTGTGTARTYTPNQDYNGPDSFTYTVTDNEGGVSLPATVTITIAAVNDGPRAATALGNRNYVEGQSVNINLSSAFSDPEGNTFTVAVTGLPAGVTHAFDPGEGINFITGTLGLSSAGVYSVTVTATETGTGLTAQQQFTITVGNTNQNPTVAGAGIEDQASDEGATVSLSIAAAFADADAGDVLTFSVTGGALPDGLSLAANGAISGTISQTAANGSPYSVTVTADDGQGGTISDTFSWTVNAVNAAPTAVGTIPDQTDTVNTSFLMNGSIVQNAFTDADGDVLSYSATGLPAGVFIDEETGTIFGSTTVSDTYSVVVTATDPGSETATQPFTITIEDP